MNIFILSEKIDQNVKYYVDKHVVKMILEHTQMLSTAVRFTGIDSGYKSTHVNHPCSQWVRESLDNWLYLKELTLELNKEWRYRYDHKRDHKSISIVNNLPIPNLPKIGLTKFALAMPEKYKTKNVVESYRNYYVNDKKDIFQWRKREIPNWINKQKKEI